jgi:uncharacterized protein YjdB
MKTGNWAFVAIAAFMVLGFVFTGCGNDKASVVAVPITDITLNRSTLGLLVGQSATLEYTLTPSYPSNKKLNWSSSSSDVASVLNGVVTAHQEGTTTITVSADDRDGLIRETCLVTVGIVEVSGVILDKAEILDLGLTRSVVLTATVLPPQAANKDVRWESSDPTIATVTGDIATREATVTGVGLGTVTISVITVDNYKTATCEITVVPVLVEGVSLEDFNLNLGRSLRLSPTWVPIDATPIEVTWESEDPEIVTISANGTITGVDLGEATIKVTTVELADGETATASCTVTVVATLPKIPMVWIEADSVTVYQGSVSTESERQQWEARHTVTLSKGFWMGTYPISQAAYKTITGENPSRFDMEGHDEYGAYFDAWPVESLTWYDAVEFCNTLSKAARRTPVYTIIDRQPEIGYPILSATVTANWDANGYRSPTETEWEYACRTGTDTAFNFKERVWDEVSYGDTTGVWGSNYIWIDWANFDGWWEYNDRATSPGQEWYNTTLPWKYFTEENPYVDNPQDYANKWGLYDMHGNVEEWCWDWLEMYPVTAGTDYRGPLVPGNTFGRHKVVRGGNWDGGARFTRSSARYGQFVYNVEDTTGFRVVCYAADEDDDPNPPASEPDPRAAFKARSRTANQQYLKYVQQKSAQRVVRDSASTPELKALYEASGRK